MEFCLKRLSVNDGRDVYDMFQSIPREERGSKNAVNGMRYEDYKCWLADKDAQSRQVGIQPNGFVPSTLYWLYVDGCPVGRGSLRHMLTDELRRAGGHMGYVIAPEYRGRGYGKLLLQELLKEAAKLGIKRALVTIYPDNLASIRTALANGGVIEETTEEYCYIWIPTQNIALKLLSPDTGRDVYDLLQAIPKDENGFMNGANGLSWDEFQAWLAARDSDSKQVGIVDGWKVPQTTFLLYVDGKPVGIGHVRHFLTDALRKAGGNIGYAVAPEYRGKGYGKILLRELLKAASVLGIDRALVTVHNGNMPSIRTALANGGEIEEVNEERHFIWINC